MSLVVLEGIDGSGKSTAARAILEDLEARGQEVSLLREPGSTTVGERVRALLLDRELTGMHPWTEACLFAASRAEMVHAQVKPLLERGVTVLLDRYLYSSVVYQGVAGGLGADAVRELNLRAVGGCHPALVLLFDLPVSEAIARREGAPDRMEAKGDAFLERVRQGYLDEVRRDPDLWRVIDARQSPEDVAREAIVRVAECLGSAG